MTPKKDGVEIDQRQEKVSASRTRTILTTALRRSIKIEVAAVIPTIVALENSSGISCKFGTIMALENNNGISCKFGTTVQSSYLQTRF
jgi:hypothetical protein